MPFTIAICDDDAAQIQYIENILKDWAADKDMEVQTDSYAGAEAFLFAYPEKPCDLLLLDIEMGTVSGMELAKQLRRKGDLLPIIFITGFSEYMSEGYDVEALHYLLKPVDKNKLYEVLDKYVSRKLARADEILVRNHEETTHIRTDSIMSIEAFGRMAELTLSDGRVVTSEDGLKSFENLQGVIHCHRSYMVNLKFVKSIGKTAVMLDSGAEVPLSRRMYREVNQAFISYYRGER